MSGATARAGEDEAAANGLATKRDLRELKADIKDDLREFKADLKDDLKEIKDGLKDDLKELKDGLKDGRKELKDGLKEIKADRKELKADIIKVAGIVVGALASAGIIAAAIVGLMQALT